MLTILTSLLLLILCHLQRFFRENLRLDAENHDAVANDEVSSTAPRASEVASEGSSKATSPNNSEHIPNVLDNNYVSSQRESSFAQDNITKSGRIRLKPKRLITETFLGLLSMQQGSSVNKSSKNLHKMSTFKAQSE